MSGDDGDDYMASVIRSGPGDGPADHSQTQRPAPARTVTTTVRHVEPVYEVNEDVRQAREAWEPGDLPEGRERTVFNHSGATRAVWFAARARAGNPWPVLGCVMAQTLAAAGPHVRLSSPIGQPASLNMFVGLVGEPASGKGLAESIAMSLFSYCDDRGEAVETPTSPLGSGEGIAEMFTERKRRGDDGPAEATPDRVLFQVPEIDTLAAGSSRSESTILPVLRQVYMGEPLGHAGASRETTRNVRRHSYRACVIMGIQPRRSDVLLRDADGGTPQRVLWLPVPYPGMPERDHTPDEPGVFKIQLPRDVRSGTSAVPVYLPEVAGEAMYAARLSRGRGETVGGMDGHLLLTQGKTAAALALMDGRRTVAPEDWAVAGEIIDLSTETREMCREACESAEVERAAARRRVSAEAEDTADDDLVRRRTEDVRKRVFGFLEAAEGVRLTYGHMATRLQARPTKSADRKSQRDRLRGVLERLTADGLIVETWTEDSRGERIPEYSLPRG